MCDNSNYILKFRVTVSHPNHNTHDTKCVIVLNCDDSEFTSTIVDIKNTIRADILDYYHLHIFDNVKYCSELTITKVDVELVDIETITKPTTIIMGSTDVVKR